LWDTALKFFLPVLQITSPDHLEYIITAKIINVEIVDFVANSHKRSRESGIKRYQ